MAFKVPALYGVEFMDVILAAAGMTTMTFGAGGNGQYNRALNGDIDGTYIIEISIIKTGGVATQITLEPNGATTNTFDRGVQVINAGTISGIVSSSFLLASVSGSDGYESQLELQARTGKERLFSGATAIRVSAGNEITRMHAGVWEDSATNITSLVIRSSVASGILTGSVARLWRRTQPA